jgi:hypothetical protein
MNDWYRIFAGAVAAYGGVRPTARLLGISPSTVSRLARGEEPDPKTAKVLGPIIGACPCCGQLWPKEDEE